MKIEEIIKKSIDKLNHDIDLRNSLYLNIIHRNIDILVAHSDSWFGSEVPKEFIEVLNSLINLSIVFGDRARKSTELIFEKSYQEFQPLAILETLKRDFIELLAFKRFTIESETEVTIITSRQIFKDSLYHIFFCVSQFATDETESTVKIYTSHSSHTIEMQFLHLSKTMPDIRTLLRLFFPHDTKQSNTQNEMNIRVGLNIAVENIKRIGGVIHIDYAEGDSTGLNVKISFPSKELLNTINDVRKYSYSTGNKEHSGVLLLSLQDKMTELLVSESMQDAGFDIEIENITKIKFLKDIENIRAIIVDYDNICRNFTSIEEFIEQMSEKRIIIIYRKNEEVYAGTRKNVRCLTVPFELDSILELVD